MRLVVFSCIALFLTAVKADRVIRAAEQFSSNGRFSISPFLERAESIHRAKRQSSMVGFRDWEQCPFDCMEVLDEKLFDEFNLQNATEINEAALNVTLVGYDAEKFEKFCDIYRPSSRCFHKCPTSKSKAFFLLQLSLAEFVCVERYEDFRKYGPCMNESSEVSDQICEDQCEIYGNETEVLANITHANITYEFDGDEIRLMLNETCLFISCLVDCDTPILSQRCGPVAADLERETVRRSFKPMRQIFELINIGEYWPDSCDVLVQGNFANFNPETGSTLPWRLNGRPVGTPRRKTSPFNSKTNIQDND